MSAVSLAKCLGIIRSFANHAGDNVPLALDERVTESGGGNRRNPVDQEYFPAAAEKFPNGKIRQKSRAQTADAPGVMFLYITAQMFPMFFIGGSARALSSRVLFRADWGLNVGFPYWVGHSFSNWAALKYSPPASGYVQAATGAKSVYDIFIYPVKK
jgi:hypothetical protein